MLLGLGWRAWASGRPKVGSYIQPGMLTRWLARSPRVKDLGWGRYWSAVRGDALDRRRVAVFVFELGEEGLSEGHGGSLGGCVTPGS